MQSKLQYLYNFLVKYNAVEAFLRVKAPEWYNANSSFNKIIDNCVNYEEEDYLIDEYEISKDWCDLNDEFSWTYVGDPIIPWATHKYVLDAISQLHRNNRTQLLRKINDTRNANYS